MIDDLILKSKQKHILKPRFLVFCLCVIFRGNKHLSIWNEIYAWLVDREVLRSFLLISTYFYIVLQIV